MRCAAETVDESSRRINLALQRLADELQQVDFGADPQSAKRALHQMAAMLGQASETINRDAGAMSRAAMRLSDLIATDGSKLVLDLAAHAQAIASSQETGLARLTRPGRIFGARRG